MMRIINTNGKIVLDKQYACHHSCQNIIPMRKRASIILINDAFINMPSAGKEKKLFPSCILMSNWYDLGCQWLRIISLDHHWFEMNNII